MKRVSSLIMSLILVLANVLIMNMLIAPIGVNNNVAAFQGGDGSAGNPYQIGNVSDLQDMNSDLTAHYIIINDIDASNTSNWNGGLGFSPIGNDTNPIATGKQGDNFTGSLDGQNYKIINLTINRSAEDYVGLFGYTNTSSVIINVTLTNIKVNGKENIGSLSGYNDGTVIHCKSNGSVSSTAATDCYAGGLLGFNTGQVTTCNSDCTTTGTATLNSQVIGGLIGQNNGIVTDCDALGDTTGSNDMIAGLVGYNIGSVIDCNAFGSTSGDDILGGLVGYNFGGTVTGCVAYGNTTGTSYVGGLIGQNTGPVTNCDALGDTKGTTDWIGGLIGYSTAAVTNCTAFGNATGYGADSDNIGGLIGYIFDGTVVNCTAYGNVSGSDDNIGGLAGRHDSGTVTNCTAFGNANGNGINSLRTAGFIGQSSGDIINCIAYGDATAFGTSCGYIAGLVGRNYYNNIINCIAYGNVSGTGSFSYLGGLLGRNSGGTITNCTAHGDVTNDGSGIGGLIGWDEDGTIIDCTAYGNVIGSSSTTEKAGGLIGYSPSSGTVTNCTAHGDVTGKIEVAGLIGDREYGTVTNCRAYGNVTGDEYIGGLIGDNYGGSVKNCSAHGDTTGISGWLGGLIGSNNMGEVTNCTAYGITNATGAGFYVGGLIGEIDSTPIANCTSYGNVIGGDYVGGFIGMTSGGTVDNCYSHGNVAGSDFVGGFIGNNTGMVNYSYSIGLVSGNQNVGGFIGINSGTVTSCFWDNETSGHTTSDGGTGKNTTEMQKEITFTTAGWDFTNIWAVKEEFTYPFFGWNYWLDPPIITTVDQLIAYEETLYLVIYQAVDPDYEVLTWNGTTNATWLTFDNQTQQLSGTPLQSDIGNYSVNITVEDPNGLIDFTNFTITVQNTNDPPVITTTDVETTNEDELYSVDYNATDIDPTNDTLTWTLDTDATWLTINQATGILSGTPDNSHVGSYWVNVTVDDGNNGNHSTNFTLTVNNVNDDPTITSPLPPYPGAVEDALYYLDFEAEDIDPTGDILTWELTTDAGWLDIDEVTGNISGTPTNTDAAITYNVNVTVTDGNDGSATRIFTIYVANLNDAPSITTTDVETTPEDDLYSVIYNASDIDPTNDVFTWSLMTNADWLDIDSVTGNLSGTPTNDDVGEYWVNVTVDDGNLAYDWHNFTLTVTNVNDDPVITTTDVTTATADELYSVDYDATDIDPTNDTLTWSLVSNASWLSIVTGTGVLSGTPTNDDVGDYSVEVTVTDSNGGSDFNSFILTVEPSGIANLNPNITTANVLTAIVGELYFVTYEAEDDHTLPGDLVWTMTTSSGWLSFNPSTHVLSGTPAAANVGTCWVLITVSDDEGGSTSTNFTITVSEAPANTKPDLTQGKYTPTSGDTKTMFTFSVHYTDADGDAPDSIKVVIDDVEHGMTLASGDAADGTYEYETTLTEGVHSYYFIANDGTDAAGSSDGTPLSAAEAKSTSDITKAAEEEEEEDDEDLFGGMTMWLIIIVVIIIIVILLAMMMRKRPSEEELLAAEEEDEIAEDMAAEEDLDEDEGVDEDEDVEEIETFECPTCGAELDEDDTVCPECGEEFDDEED
jgi:hypothetical protein